ncbi:MAG: bifunctional methionine sulfoxide reductase B/A protein [Phycisphaerales bacterium]|nr:bifunctional methionine sulfoxide reductase B/A protein [Phycisphaerales bacterium]
MAPDATPQMSASGHDITPLTDAQKAPLVAKLTPEQVEITQKAGTERPFCGTLLDNKQDGAYHCVVCDLPLFASTSKFDSGSGWPSFTQAFDPQHITRTEDRSHGMIRTEISCARCDAHLGHVFPDGPPPTGERHCLNSESLTFVVDTDGTHTATAYFAGGCFWGIEHYFQLGPGVIDAQSGYMNGDVKDPDYRAVCTGETGHAEAVKVVYDPEVITYERLLQAFFDMHDPTQVDRQGPDVGTQYRSGIYTVDDAQAQAARAFIAAESASGRHDRAIATEVEPADTFYPAEAYHQDYIAKTGRVCHVSNPWGADEH